MSVPTEKKGELAEALITTILLWKNPYDIFDAKPDTPLDEIHRKYKKISLHVHPDKCKLPQAEEAFHALKKALGVLKDEEHADLRRTYHKIMEKSRDKVRDLWKSQGKIRRTKDDDKSFEKDVKRMTQKIILDIEAENARAEELRLANERREKEQKLKEQELIKVEMEHDEKWEEHRDVRVDSWREFQLKTTKKRKNPEDDIANLEPVDGASAATPSESTTPSATDPSTSVKPANTSVKLANTPVKPANAPVKPANNSVKPASTSANTSVKSPSTSGSNTVAKPPAQNATATSPSTKPEPVVKPILGSEPDKKKKKYTPKPLKPPKIKLS